MTRSPSPDHQASWLVVLPDCAKSIPLAARLGPHATRAVPHPSGRPWLLGQWDPHKTAASRQGENALVLSGDHGVGPAELARLAGRLRDPGSLDTLVRPLPGSFVAFASTAGQVTARSSLLGVRRLFSGVVGGVTVAADRADVLAWLLGASVAPEWLAARLLSPYPPHPIAGRPVWQGVQELPGDHYLVLDRAGTARQVRWWQPPDPELPLAQGAAALRERLAAAVQVRTQRATTLTSDLSGVDSTALCSLAVRGGTRVLACTAASIDPLDDDLVWARQAVALLPNLEHEVIPAAAVPLTYSGLTGVHERFDEPNLFAVDRRRIRTNLQWAADHGSDCHLGGYGGDEVFGGSPTWVYHYLRRQPRLALRNLRGYAVRGRWTRRRILAQLADRRSLPAWLEGVAADVTAPMPPLSEPLLGWDLPPRLPDWITPDAVDCVRALLRSEADAARPLAPVLGQHCDLEMMLGGSRLFRQLAQIAAPMGVRLTAPYYDDQVIEAALAVRPQDRVNPFRFKPLAVAAMRGVVPDPLLDRGTKADGTAARDVGLRTHRLELLALFEDSALAAQGLINLDRVRAVCTRPPRNVMELADVLYPTIGCEVWLQNLVNGPSGLGKDDDAEAAQRSAAV